MDDKYCEVTAVDKKNNTYSFVIKCSKVPEIMSIIGWGKIQEVKVSIKLEVKSEV